MLHLDFDIYKPSKVAIDNFLPRMPKGSIIALDGTNCPEGPGEAIALLESLNINKISFYFVILFLSNLFLLNKFNFTETPTLKFCINTLKFVFTY